MSREDWPERTEADQVVKAMAYAVDRINARKGEIISSWGPVTLDAVTIARFNEAVGLPVRDDANSYVPPAILYLINRRPIDVHKDARPVEQTDNALGNPVNGGTCFRFRRHLRKGEAISGSVVFQEASLRTGRSGPLAIVVKRTAYRDEAGQEVATLDHTMVYRGLH